MSLNTKANIINNRRREKRCFAGLLLSCRPEATSCGKSLLSCKNYHSGPYASINCHDSDTPPQEKGCQIHRPAVRTSGTNDGISLLRSVRAIPYRLRLTAPICPAKAPQTLAANRVQLPTLVSLFSNVAPRSNDQNRIIPYSVQYTKKLRLCPNGHNRNP